MATTLEGATCGVPACDSLMERKIGGAATKIAGKDYWVCSNWQFHSNYKAKDDPNKSPFIMAADANAIKMHLMKLRGELPAPVAAPAGDVKKRKYENVGDPLPTDVHQILVDIKTELVALRELLEARNNQ